MKKAVIIICLFLETAFPALCQKWTVKEPFKQKSFIENDGKQFDGGIGNKKDIILFSAVINGVTLYFTNNQVVYRYNELIPDSSIEDKPKEEDKVRAKLIPKYFSLKWENADTNAIIEAEDKEMAYNTYYINDHSIIANNYKKIRCKNIYPGIDIEYSFSSTGKGLEYAIIVSPGADISRVKLLCSNNNVLSAKEKEGIIMESAFGKFIFNAPESECSFRPLNKNELILNEKGYDKTKRPQVNGWIENPAFLQFDKGYDVNYDNQGNVYVYGGVPPYQLEKYNNKGTLQWTANMPFDTTDLWAGDFTVDHRSGSAFVTSGLGGYSGYPDIVKINSSGVVIRTNYNSSIELWRIKFDYCNNQLVIGAGLAQQAALADTSLNRLSPVYILPTTETQHDIVFMALDGLGSAYMATNLAFGPTDFNNIMLRLPLPGLLPSVYTVPDNYYFRELASLKYYPYQNNGSGLNYANGFNGMAVNRKMLITYDGSILKKWIPATGKFQKSATVTSTPFQCGGLDIDCSNSIYVGSMKSVAIYDSSLAFVSSIPLTDTVYDVKLGNSNIYACGKGFVSSTPSISDSLYIVLKSKPPTSCSTCNGSIIAYIKGCGLDSASYTYQWSNGETTATDTGLCNGHYTVSVIVNCMLQFTDSITFPSGTSGGMSINVTSKNLTCGSINDGSAFVTVSGGNAPYTYEWLPSGNTTDSISGLSAGTYSIVVTDKSGDCNSMLFTINPAPVPTIKTTSLGNESCPGSPNGFAAIVASSGTSPYSYNWQPGGKTTDSVYGLAQGLYTVTVTDGKGCVSSDTIRIADELENDVKVNTTNSCGGSNTGTASVTISGNINFYFITWFNGASGNTVSNLGSGTYYVTVRDSDNGCSITDTFKITQEVTPVLNITQANEKCFGESIGTALVSVIGGGGNYTYNWNTGSTDTLINNLSAGTYSVIVADSAGCSTTGYVTITQPQKINAVIIASNDSCKDRKDGTASVTVSGGTPPYSYTWMPSGNTNTSISNLGIGNYSVIIVDTAGCSVKDSVNIKVKPVNVSILGNDSICYRSSATLMVTGALNYEWSNGANSSSVNVSPLFNVTYSVIVTDSNKCSDSLYKTITVNPLPVSNVCCDTTIYSGQSVQLFASGGMSYIWTPATGLSCNNCPDPFANPQQTQNYTVVISANNGCSVNDSVLITVENCGQLFVPEAFSPNGDGQNDVLFVRGKCIESFNFMVFDRWGNKVFETQNTNTGWNGMYKGQPMNTGTYVYELKVILYDKSTIEKHGNIVLVR